jgi:hypothetical protein
MDIQKYSVPFWILVAIVALLVASPALSRAFVWPRTQFFTELWLLGPGHRAKNYPFNINSGQSYSIYLGVGNHLGYCAYYVVEVKFRNETSPKPNSLGPIENRTPSSLPSLFNITAFVADEGNWELPSTFSFEYDVDVGNSVVTFHDLTLNDVALDLEGYSTTWNSTAGVFFGDLIFELWIYSSSPSLLSYHGRFVDLKLNMTSY